MFNVLVIPINISRRLENISGYFLATMLLFAYAPLIGFIALAIYIDSAEPVLLRRTLKVDGQPDVRSLLFRTARRPGDLRPARFGTFLRNSGLDRLPQLLTVLRGGIPLVSRAAAAAPPRPVA